MDFAGWGDSWAVGSGAMVLGVAVLVVRFASSRSSEYSGESVALDLVRRDVAAVLAVAVEVVVRVVVVALVTVCTACLRLAEGVGATSLPRSDVSESCGSCVAGAAALRRVVTMLLR
jgi:hypothetical protein